MDSFDIAGFNHEREWEKQKSSPEKREESMLHVILKKQNKDILIIIIKDVKFEI